MSDGGRSGDIVLRERRGSLEILTLNRPERRNAIDMDLRVALAEALEDAMADDAVRAIVLTGAGGTFCSGGDISSMQRQSPADTLPRARAAARVITAIWDGGTPVVAAVEGAAFGAGVSLALACDRVVVASDARVSTSFTRVGLAGDMGIFATLPARVGPVRARQLLMWPTLLSAGEAVEAGLFDVAVDPGTALERAVADAEVLTLGPPLALRGILAMLRQWPRDPRQVLEDEVQLQGALFQTYDFAEGVEAFHQKRPASFEGR